MTTSDYFMAAAAEKVRLTADTPLAVRRQQQIERATQIPVADVADACDEVATLIEARGHCKGRAVAHDGRVCAVGALDLVQRAAATPAEGGCLRVRVLLEVSKYLSLPFTSVLHMVATWNDMPERSADEVIAAFRDTAAALRAQSLVETPATTVAVYDPRWVIDAPESAVRTVVEVVS